MGDEEIPESINSIINESKEDKEEKLADLRSNSYLARLQGIKESIGDISKREHISVPVEDALAFQEIAEVIRGSTLRHSEVIKDQEGERKISLPMASEQWVKNQLLIKKKNHLRRNELTPMELEEINNELKSIFDDKKRYLIRVGYPIENEVEVKRDYYWVVSPKASVSQDNIDKAKKLSKTDQPELPGF